MILGDTCTRRCGFCNVKTGKPTFHDPLEPARVARQVATMGCATPVITSVDRDDLPDYGASAFVGVIRQIRHQAPECKVEVLHARLPRREMPLAKVIAERPDVFNHNVEVVPRCIRSPGAARSSCAPAACCATPRRWAATRSSTKSGLMVGLGETHDELVDAFGVLREHGVQVLTVGQYLRRPSATFRSCATGIPTSSPLWSAPRWTSGFENVACRAARPLQLPRGRARPAGAPGRRPTGRRHVRHASGPPRRAIAALFACPRAPRRATARAVTDR
jgi:lipoic acid synthetase